MNLLFINKIKGDKMGHKYFNTIICFVLTLVLSSSISFSQSNNNPNTKNKNHIKVNKSTIDYSKIMWKNHKFKMARYKMKIKNKIMVESSIVHKGNTDLKYIDKNKDGFVYQDENDWNVISDKPSVCPLCGMKLEKHSIELASRYLKEYRLLEYRFKLK